MNNFNEKVVENLKHEVECLNYSLSKAREDGNFSMYKNLINSYRDTVMLINELQKDGYKVQGMFSISPNGVFEMESPLTDEGVISDKLTNKVTIGEDLRVNNHMIKNTIEKEIKEGIEKIDCYRGRGFISVEAKKFMDKYDVVIKAGFDIDVPVFRNKIRDIISNMLLKNFVDTVKLVQHIGNDEFNYIVFSDKYK